MAATVTTITPDMGDAMICALVDDAFDSLFSEGSVATTSKQRVAGNGQSIFVSKFNANVALLVTALAGLSTQTQLTGGTSWQGMISTINTVLGNCKTVVDAL